MSPYTLLYKCGTRIWLLFVLVLSLAHYFRSADPGPKGDKVCAATVVYLHNFIEFSYTKMDCQENQCMLICSWNAASLKNVAFVFDYLFIYSSIHDRLPNLFTIQIFKNMQSIKIKKIKLKINLREFMIPCENEVGCSSNERYHISVTWLFFPLFFSAN